MQYTKLSIAYQVIYWHHKASTTSTWRTKMEDIIWRHWRHV